MNAASEVAVASFLAGEYSYLGIAEMVERVMDAHASAAVESLEQLAAVDAASREAARGFIAAR